MSLQMKLVYLFVPFIRLSNILKRAVSPYINRFFALKPSDTTFKLSTWDNEATIQTKYGMISGFLDKSSWCWKGIPYASPPVGSLRWKAPLDPIPPFIVSGSRTVKGTT